MGRTNHNIAIASLSELCAAPQARAELARWRDEIRVWCADMRAQLESIDARLCEEPPAGGAPRAETPASMGPRPSATASVTDERLASLKRQLTQRLESCWEAPALAADSAADAATTAANANQNWNH